MEDHKSVAKEIVRRQDMPAAELSDKDACIEPVTYKASDIGMD